MLIIKATTGKNKNIFLALKLADDEFIQLVHVKMPTIVIVLINVKMPNIVNILTFISKIHFMLLCVEHKTVLLT